MEPGHGSDFRVVASASGVGLGSFPPPSARQAAAFIARTRWPRCERRRGTCWCGHLDGCGWSGTVMLKPAESSLDVQYRRRRTLVTIDVAEPGQGAVLPPGSVRNGLPQPLSAVLAPLDNRPRRNSKQAPPPPIAGLRATVSNLAAAISPDEFHARSTSPVAAAVASVAARLSPMQGGRRNRTRFAALPPPSG